jgi:hypothetical protein
MLAMSSLKIHHGGIVNFRWHEAFDNTARRDLYSLMWATIMGNKSIGLLKILVLRSIWEDAGCSRGLEAKGYG